MDVLVPIPMKNAAKCDKQCELQNSANHQIFERKWRQRDILPACLFQCLRGFTLILMWLTCWCSGVFIDFALSIVSHERCASGSFGPMKWSHHSHVISLEAPNYPHPRGSTALLTLVLPSIPCIWDRQDHPLNLSISLSGGKEINEDCLSSGERSGKSPSLKSGVFHLRIVI